MNLAKLQARLKELSGDLDILTKKDGVPEGEQAAHFEAIDKAASEMEAIEKNIAILKRAEDLASRSAAPSDAPIVTDERSLGTVPAAPAQKFGTSEKIGVMVFSMAKAFQETGIKGYKATFDMMEKSGYGSIANEFGIAQRAASTGAGSGGVLVPEDMADDIIDLLRPTTTFLQGNPKPVSLVNGNYRLPKALSGATAAWRGEGQAIQASQPTFNDINMSAKFLDALVPITNQLIRWSLSDVRSWIERDMASELGRAFDMGAYFGPGTANAPLGIANVVGVTSNPASGGKVPTVANIEADAALAELSMEGRNLPMTSAAWVMAPRTATFLGNLRDGNGNRYFPELHHAMPLFRGRPVLKTTQVSVTGGATTDESKILLINFDDVLYGKSKGLSFGVSTDAAYVNSSGDTVSAFQNDLTLIKASMETDVALRYTEAVAVINKVQWGAA